MAEKEAKNPYQMNLIEASKSKLYRQSDFWAFQTAKYRALLSNDPAIIKYFYRHEAGMFYPDIYNFAEMTRSFYYGDENTENAEEYFGLIPMICESIAKLVCGGGYEFDEGIPTQIRERLKAILDDNEFDNEQLKPSLIETLGLGDAAWHIHFDPEISDYPLIELIPPERLAIKRKSRRIVQYTIKQQVYFGDEPQPYELHTIYTKRRKKVDRNGAPRYVDDGIQQEYRIWNGSRYIDDAAQVRAKIFKAYDIQRAKNLIPIVDFPVVYLPNTLNSTGGAAVLNGNTRPYGVVYGLESNSSALDEILSNCVDTVRKCFPFLLIDEQMIPSNLQGDKEKGAFSTRRHSYVIPRNAKEAEKLLQMIQAKLNTTEYVESAKFQINIALNKAGINAATLGLQLSGHIEAEGTQNAKERNSIRTRNSVAADYERYLEKLFAVLLQYDDYINGSTIATDTRTGEQAIVASEYHGIKAHFRKYIVDTPEELAEVLAKKVQANIMSRFAAVRELHPDWTDEAIYKETNLIYAERAGGAMQVVDPTKPPEESAVMVPDAGADDSGGKGAENDLQAADEGEGKETPDADNEATGG